MANFYFIDLNIVDHIVLTKSTDFLIPIARWCICTAPRLKCKICIFLVRYLEIEMDLLAHRICILSTNKGQLGRSLGKNRQQSSITLNKHGGQL